MTTKEQDTIEVDKCDNAFCPFYEVEYCPRGSAHSCTLDEWAFEPVPDGLPGYGSTEIPPLCPLRTRDITVSLTEVAP